MCHKCQGLHGGARGFPVRLDVTDPDQVSAAAEACSDVTLLVDNAGVLTDSPLLAAPALALAIPSGEGFGSATHGTASTR